MSDEAFFFAVVMKRGKGLADPGQWQMKDAFMCNTCLREPDMNAFPSRFLCMRKTKKEPNSEFAVRLLWLSCIIQRCKSQ